MSRKETILLSKVGDSKCVFDVNRRYIITYDSNSQTEEKLTDKEFNILSFLVENKCVAVKRKDIVTFAWGENASDYLSDSSLGNPIKTLRRKILYGKKVIDTSRGYGYIFEPYIDSPEVTDDLFEECGKNSYLERYYAKKRHAFEDIPDEPTIVGDLSVEQAYIDVEVELDIGPLKGVHASDEIWRWCTKDACGARILYGQPGHGKTTLGLKLVHDYITEKVDFKVFCFPLVTHYYCAVADGRVQIYNTLRLDESNDKSVLDDGLIEGSLIILDGFDELQNALMQNDPDNPYIDPVRFFNVINDFAIDKRAHILITTRVITIESLTKKKRKPLRLISMKSLSEHDQYNWIANHKISYLPIFKQLRRNYAKVNPNISTQPFGFNIMEDIFGIPFIFLMVVAAEFDGKANNIVQLYDKLFEVTMKRRDSDIDDYAIVKEKKKYEEIAFDMLPNNGKYVITTKRDKQDYSMYTYSYYMKASSNVANTSDSNEVNRFIEFYHRTFYEYFLAHFLYNRFYNATYDDVDEYLYLLGTKDLPYSVLTYVKQIMKNDKDYIYNEIVQKRVEQTDALIIRSDINPLYRCNTIFKNALLLMNILSGGLSLHTKIAANFSSYEDTKLCQLLRLYNCTGVDLSGCVLIGAHINDGNFRKSRFCNADMSGKTYMTFCNFTGCDFFYANMTDIDMYRSVLDSSQFAAADMSYGRFDEGSFKGASFLNTNLRGASFRFANLSGARLMGVYVDEYTNFNGAKLDGVITDCDLSCCIPDYHELIQEGVIKYLSQDEDWHNDDNDIWDNDNDTLDLF